jgi:hypothetical protein
MLAIYAGYFFFPKQGRPASASIDVGRSFLYSTISAVKKCPFENFECVVAFSISVHSP